MSVLTQMVHRLLVIIAFVLPSALRWRLLAWRHRGAHRRQKAALLSPGPTQLQTLLRIVEANRSTEFGRVHAFDRVQDAATFAARVPLRTYAELEPFIQRHRRGESGVLVGGTLVGFATGGGSGGRSRPVPVTPASLEVWGRAEALLTREMLKLRPAVARGDHLHLLPCYQARTSRSALPVAPMAVLAASSEQKAGRPAVVPYQLFSIADQRQRYYLILRLSMARRITVLRAANPGTLGIFAERLEALGPALLDDLASGEVRHLTALPEPVRAEIPPQRPEPALAQRLRQRLSQRGRLEPGCER